MLSLRSATWRFALPLLLLLSSAERLAAQKPDNPAKARVILRKEQQAALFDTVDCVKNVIKMNPLLFLRGEVPIYYERAITQEVSVQLGVGFTTRDFLNLSGTYTDADNFGEGVTIVPKMSYHLSTRYYGTDDLEPQGWYVELEFAHLNYSKDISQRDTITAQLISPEQKLRDQRIYNDIRLLTGYQLLSYSSNWLLDFYAGVGLRDRYMDIVSETVDISTNRYSYSVEHVDDVVPVFFIGFRVGVGF